MAVKPVIACMHLPCRGQVLDEERSDNRDLGTEGGELRIVFLVEVVERPHVLGVADEPVHRWKVLPLRQLLVKAPEHLDNAEGGRRHRVREITTRRRHSTQCSQQQSGFMNMVQGVDHFTATLTRTSQHSQECKDPRRQCFCHWSTTKKLHT